MITFPYIHIEGSVGKEFCQEHKLDSGSMIYKKTKIKGSSTAWHVPDRDKEVVNKDGSWNDKWED